MNVNLSNIARAYQINQQQTAVNILMRQKKSGNTQMDTPHGGFSRAATSK